MTEENMQELTEQTNERIDLLDRGVFVQRIVDVCEMLSTNKKNACFAINGQWGIGKSFVLEMFEERINKIQQEDTATNKYFLFHYNCWNYDYYDEPIVAIVASMLDEIEKNENLFTDDDRARFKGLLKAVGSGLMLIVDEGTKKHLNISAKEVWEVITDGYKDTTEQIAQNHDYDIYFDFKKILNRLKEAIKLITKDRTVLIVVDELDRCLPEYTIKVLERLHHVFDEIPNVQVIISVDKSQLEHTVKQIYGEKTDVEKYLAKFIDFEFDLSEGLFENEIKYWLKFDYYFSNFEIMSVMINNYDVNQFFQMIFEGLNIRSRIAIIDKCLLIHDLIKNDNDKMDMTYMCLGILLSIFKHEQINIDKTLNSDNVNLWFDNNSGIAIKGIISLAEQYNSNNKKYIERYKNKCTIWPVDFWGVLLAAYRYAIGAENDILEIEYFDSELLNYGREFWSFLKIIN